MAIAIGIAGLFPGFAGLFTTALESLVVRFGNTTIAGRLAVVFLRTVGFIQNRTGFLAQPVPSNAFTRLVFGTPTFLSPIFGFPGTSSFLKGFAYRDNEELTRGWLSFFGELLLAEVPGVEGNFEVGLKRLKRGDFAGFGESVANAFQEDLGLAAVGAFFRGIAEIDRDFQKLGLPTLYPAPWVFGGLFAVVNFFDALITQTGRDLGGLLGGLVDPPRPGEKGRGKLPRDPALQNFLDDLKDPSRTLPTTPTAVRRSLVTFRRSISRFRAARGILELLKSQEGRRTLSGKLQRLVGRL